MLRKIVVNSGIEMPKSNFAGSLHWRPPKVSPLFLSGAFVIAAYEMGTATARAPSGSWY